MTDYDSRADTLKHSQRVGEYMMQMIKEALDRSTCHDRSKTEPPEVEAFDCYTPKLKDLTYGSDEYRSCLREMKPALEHHYAVNRHHPEHFENGIDDMTLVDLIEMTADWKAATERSTTGDLAKSLDIQKERFSISDQLMRVLWNTARHFRWLSSPCGDKHIHPSGIEMTCNVPVDRPEGHTGKHADGNWDGGSYLW